MFKLSAVFAVITDYITVMSSVTDYVTVMSSVLVSCAFRTSSMVLCLWIICSLCGPRPSILITVHPSLDSKLVIQSEYFDRILGPLGVQFVFTYS